jgi:hypothetical protein
VFRGTRAKVALALAAALEVPGTVPPVRAQDFPSVVERTVGSHVEVAPFRLLSPRPATLRVEVGDIELFGIAGLRVSGVRAVAAHRRVLLSGSLFQVSSPVGNQSRAMVETGFLARGLWQGALRAGSERVALEGAQADGRRVVGAISRVDVGPAAAVADFERVTGLRVNETTLTLSLLVTAGVVQLAGHARAEGDRFAGAGVAVAARLHSALCLMAGYEDGTQTARAAAVVGWNGFEVAAGAFQHPVLGTSQGVMVACAR